MSDTQPDSTPPNELSVQQPWAEGLTRLEAHKAHYTETNFWRKVTLVPRKVGGELIEKALWLYYLLGDSKTPLWAKGVILGALGYFISPLDAIPDFIPVVGFTDDLGAVLAVLSVVAAHVTDEIKEKARHQRELLLADDPDTRFPIESASHDDGARDARGDGVSR